MIKNFVLETVNAPGTSTSMNLAGAATDRFSFAGAGFTNGQVLYYVMDDGAQFEWGVGTFNTGSPNTLSRTTVLGNSAGTQPSKLNFTGTTDVYCDLPAEKRLYINNSNIVSTLGATLELGSPGLITANGNRALFRGWMSGFGTSRNAGTPNTKIDIAVGAAMDQVAQAGFIVSNGTLTIDFGTTGANGMDTGSLTNTTFFYSHVIGKADGTVAGFGSTSLTPTLPSGYTMRAAVGAHRTDGSAHFLPYTQTDEEFLYTTEIDDIPTSTILGTSPTNYALSAPPNCIALFRAHGFRSTAWSIGIIGAGATVGSAVAMGGSPSAVGGTGFDGVRVSGSREITAAADSAGTSFALTTRGFIFTRGRLS